MSTLWAHGHTDQEIVDAMVKANGDRALLDRLVNRGRVKALANAMWHHRKSRPPVNPTIRPNKKKARKRK